MKKLSGNRSLSLAVDIALFALLLAQMLFIFIGSTAHELLGMAFFLCLIVHVLLKGWWFKGFWRARGLRLAFNLVTLALLCSAVLLMLSAMGVSRLLFPWVRVLGSVSLHRYMATAVLTLAVLHGGLRFCLRPGKRKLKLALTALLCGLSLALGLALVPYMNRHLKTVEIDYAQAVAGEKLTAQGKQPLVVYFTRLGNTAFEETPDAVSGASLLLADGQLMGNSQLLAHMLQDMLGCPAEAITLTGQPYPATYNATVTVAQGELRRQERPTIAPIDASGADTVVLVYPLWWGTLPMPVATFLEQNDFTGKTLALVATQGSSGFGSSARDIAALAPGAQVEEWVSVYCDDIPVARQQLLDAAAKHLAK